VQRLPTKQPKVAVYVIGGLILTLGHEGLTIWRAIGSGKVVIAINEVVAVGFKV
jgi:hypothetical protein